MTKSSADKWRQSGGGGEQRQCRAAAAAPPAAMRAPSKPHTKRMAAGTVSIQNPLTRSYRAPLTAEHPVELELARVPVRQLLLQHHRTHRWPSHATRRAGKFEAARLRPLLPPFKAIYIKQCYKPVNTPLPASQPKCRPKSASSSDTTATRTSRHPARPRPRAGRRRRRREVGQRAARSGALRIAPLLRRHPARQRVRPATSPAAALRMPPGRAPKASTRRRSSRSPPAGARRPGLLPLEVREAAEKLSAFVAANGRKYEDLTRERNSRDSPLGWAAGGLIGPAVYDGALCNGC